MSDVLGQRVGRYQLLGPLPGAGTRRLWQVADETGQELVLKWHAPDGLASGLAECQLLGLVHPGVAACFDAGRQPGTGELYTVTDLVRGEALAPGTVLPGGSEARRTLALQLLGALEAVHAWGLLHRDLKDENVLLEHGSGRPVLIDFGLACVRGQAARLPLAGTPRAFAPELFAGAPASVASDLWAAGLLLAEACLGRRLFHGRDPASMAAERAAYPGFTAEQANLLGDKALVALLERLLQPDPAARPADASLAMAALPPPSDELARRLASEQLEVARCRALATARPARQARLLAVREGRCRLELSDLPPAEALAALRRALLGWLAGAGCQPLEPELAARLADPAGFPVTAAEVELLARGLAQRVPLEIGWSLRDDQASSASPSWAAGLLALPGLRLDPEPVPGVGGACAVLRDWLGPALAGSRGEQLLVARLSHAPPASWPELEHCLAELARSGAVRLASGSLGVEDQRLPASWPQGDQVDPAAGRPAAEADILRLLALSPRPLAAPLVARLLAAPADHVTRALNGLEGDGLVCRRRSTPHDLYDVADGRLRRRLQAGGAPPRAVRVALAVALVEAAGEGSAAPAASAGRVGSGAGAAGAAGDALPHGRLDEALAHDVCAVLGQESQPADEPQVPPLVLAAVATLRPLGRHAVSAAALRRALLGCPTPSPVRRQLQVELVDALTRTTEYAAAQTVLDEARAEGGDPAGLVIAQARLLELTGKLPEALALLVDLERRELPFDEALLGLQLRSDLRKRLGQLDGARADLREALRRHGEQPSRRAMTLLERLGTLEAGCGRPAEAVRHLEHCLSMARALGMDVHVWSPMFNLGRALWARGDRRRGLELQEEAARLCEASGQRYGLVTILTGIGVAALELGRIDPACRALLRALHLARNLGDAVQEAQVLNNLARARAAEGRLAEAEEAFAESLGLRAARGDVVGQIAVAVHRGPLRLQQGRIEAAAEDLALALDGLQRTEHRGWAAGAALLEARLALATGAPAAAREAAARAEAVATERAQSRERWQARALLGQLGALDLEAEDLAGAERSLGVVELALERARLRHAAGRWREAQLDLDLALTILGETPDGPLEAEVLVQRVASDLEQFRPAGGDSAAEVARLGELLARVTRDAERAATLVALHGLSALGRELEALRARLSDMDQVKDAGGLSSIARRLRDLERLVEINKLLNTERDSQRLLDLIVDSALDLTGAARGFIILFEGQAEEFRAARNIDESTIRDPQFQVSHSVARRVAREGRPLLTANAIDDPRLAAATSITELQLLSILCVPLRSRERVLGAVYLDHPQVVGRFEESHLETVTALSEQAAIAIENARLSHGLELTNKELRSSREEVSRLNDALKERLARREAELEETRESLDASRRALALRYDYGNIVTCSPRMHSVLDMMDRVTDTDFAVVIYGESGTGKELMARAIHFNGARREKNFLTLNCAALPETLIESELFGHVRGAFTGADRDRKGLFAQADGGTLFLDEIGDMSLDVQKRLLRVLQESEFLPVGGREVQKVDVRILCATHRDLRVMMEQGRFREDLYYRLDVARIELPPLRDRPEDIALLVPHFLERHGARRVPVDPEALAMLQARPWPGNVRELEHFVMTLLLFGKDSPRIDVPLVSRVLGVRAAGGEAPLVPAGAARGTGSAVPADGLPAGEGAGPLRERLEAFEREMVRQALARAGGNKAQAARELGVGVRSLYKMLERLGL